MRVICHSSNSFRRSRMYNAIRKWDQFTRFLQICRNLDNAVWMMLCSDSVSGLVYLIRFRDVRRKTTLMISTLFDLIIIIMLVMCDAKILDSCVFSWIVAIAIISPVTAVVFGRGTLRQVSMRIFIPDTSQVHDSHLTRT